MQLVEILHDNMRLISCQCLLQLYKSTFDWLRDDVSGNIDVSLAA